MEGTEEQEADKMRSTHVSWVTKGQKKFGGDADFYFIYFTFFYNEELKKTESYRSERERRV